MGANALLDAALQYARRGWSIIPIRHKPGTDGKQAAVPWREYQKRRPTDSELHTWFGNERPVDGLAVILGRVSGGLVCRDFDDLAAYGKWAAEHPELASRLPTVETARGRHVYFRSTWTGFKDLGDGELRGDSKHYCLLPPSKHPGGRRYKWLIPLPDAPLPQIDPYAVGLGNATQRRRDTETEKHKQGRRRRRSTMRFGLRCRGQKGSATAGFLSWHGRSAACRSMLGRTLARLNR
jgi:hypothetical protein